MSVEWKYFTDAVLLSVPFIILFTIYLAFIINVIGLFDILIVSLLAYAAIVFGILFLELVWVPLVNKYYHEPEVVE